MSGWTVGWLAWIAWFAIEEGFALTRGSDPTLSGHVWKWFGVKGKHPRYKRVRRLALLAGLAWLTVHFMTGGWV